LKANHSVRGRTQVAHAGVGVDRCGGDDIFAALLQLACGRNGEAISRLDAPCSRSTTGVTQSCVNQIGVLRSRGVCSFGIWAERSKIRRKAPLQVRALIVDLRNVQRTDCGGGTSFVRRHSCAQQIGDGNRRHHHRATEVDTAAPAGFPQSGLLSVDSNYCGLILCRRFQSLAAWAPAAEDSREIIAMTARLWTKRPSRRGWSERAHLIRNTPFKGADDMRLSQFSP